MDFPSLATALGKRKLESEKESMITDSKQYGDDEIQRGNNYTPSNDYNGYINLNITDIAKPITHKDNEPLSIFNIEKIDKHYPTERQCSIHFRRRMSPEDSWSTLD